jgi:lincosamide nucleotidyltransferase A/C/D/E
MPQEQLLDFLGLCDELRIEVWLDGAWGVDALLREQTRLHRDVDIVVGQLDGSALDSALRQRGFDDFPIDDQRPWLVDFHVVTFDGEGNGIYGPVEQGEIWPDAASFAGLGRVGGRPVRCTTPECQMTSHTGCPHRESDARDVALLAERFGVEVPRQYRSA